MKIESINELNKKFELKSVQNMLPDRNLALQNCRNSLFNRGQSIIYKNKIKKNNKNLKRSYDISNLVHF